MVRQQQLAVFFKFSWRQMFEHGRTNPEFIESGSSPRTTRKSITIDSTSPSLTFLEALRFVCLRNDPQVSVCLPQLKSALLDLGSESL
jgi:hypothetical protein